MAYDVEYTDTYGGESNYSWVRRAVIPGSESNRETMRQAKAAMGLTGVRGRTFHYGDLSEFRPYRSCTVLFVTWRDPINDAPQVQA